VAGGGENALATGDDDDEIDDGDDDDDESSTSGSRMTRADMIVCIFVYSDNTMNTLYYVYGRYLLCTLS
jgi:hypothetical protein